MMKWNWTIFLSLVVFGLYGQSFKGILKDNLGMPLSGTILIKDPKDKELVKEFFQIEENGKIAFNLKHFSSKIIFEARAMGYEVYEDSLIDLQNDKEYTLDIRLIPTSIELEDVVISTIRTVLTKKDTTEYYPKAFLNGTERKLEDLLKRLPGLQVSENGRLKYLGKIVEAVQLDGDDIFGSNYTIGTKNISVGLVEKVQAIDNFVSNPLLKGVVRSETVALNIVLKKTKIQNNVEGFLGLGLGKNSINRDIGGDWLLFNNRVKSFSNIRHNNIGENAYNLEYSNSQADNILSNELSPQLSQKIIKEQIPDLPINSKNARINNEFATSMNVLSRLNKKLLSKTNIYFLRDELTKVEHNEVDFLQSYQKFDDHQSIVNKPKQGQFLSKLEYTINSSNLLNYEISFNKQLDYQRINLTQNQTQFFQNKLKSSTNFFINKVDFTHKISTHKIIQLKSIMGKSFTNQELLINTSDTTFIGNRQAVSNTILDFQNQLCYFQRKANINTTIILGQQSNNINFASSLFKRDTKVNGFENDIHYQLQSYSAKIKWDIEKNGLLFTPELRLVAYKNGLFEYNTQTHEELQRIVFEPAFQLNYKPNTTNIITISGDRKYKPMAIENIFLNGILEENRIIKKNDVNVDFQKTNQLLVGYKFHEPFSFFAVNISTFWKQDYNIWLNNVSFNPNFIQFISFRLPQTFTNKGLIFGMDKLISGLKISVKYSGQLGIFNYKNIVNDSELRDNRSAYQTHTIFLKTGFSLPFGFENTSNIAKYDFKSGGVKQSDVIGIDNSLKFYYKWKDWTFMSNYKSVMPQTTSKNIYRFLDFELSWKRPKANTIFEYRLIGNNILGTNYFKSWSNSDFAVTTYQTNLIGRYVLLSASVRL